MLPLSKKSFAKNSLLLIVAFMVFSSCEKEHHPVSYMSTGQIKGQVLSNIVCGYGYAITEDGDKTTVHKFVDPLPAGSGIDLKTAVFPIHVQYNWHLKEAPNPCNFIVIDAVRKID